MLMTATRRQSSTATRYHHGWRAPLPRRKSTKLPANSCGHEVTPPTCISNCWRNWAGPTKCLLLPVENRPSLAAVMAVLSGGLRRAACPSEIAVIEPPYDLDERGVSAFHTSNLTHDEHGITYIESA